MTSLEDRLRSGLPQDEDLPRPSRIGDVAERAGLLDVALATADSPVGRLVLAATDVGIVACSYDDEREVAERLARSVSPRVLRAPRRLDRVRRELEAYFEQRLRGFSTPIDLRLATPFGQTVLEALDRVPYGTTITYGRLATAIGRPAAARAVGLALGANPVCVIKPCHRVVGASGRLTGYAGGLDAKRRLLDLESGRRAKTGSDGSTLHVS